MYRLYRRLPSQSSVSVLERSFEFIEAEQLFSYNFVSGLKSFDEKAFKENFQLNVGGIWLTNVDLWALLKVIILYFSRCQVSYT